MNGNEIKRVHTCKYLGITLSDNLNNSLDIGRGCSQFLKQFYAIYRKFNYANWTVLKFLFESHCISFYGSELWYDRKNCTKEFNALSVTYHKMIKKMKYFPIWEGN